MFQLRRISWKESPFRVKVLIVLFVVASVVLLIGTVSFISDVATTIMS